LLKRQILLPLEVKKTTFCIKMTRLFILGATGYIGGDALYAVVQAHPEYEITALVRNSDKGAVVAKEYAKVKLVYGDLDSVELIEEESKKADIVCRKYTSH
jgi:N-acetyl-gamma-glutamylphosphate reductase